MPDYALASVDVAKMVYFLAIYPEMIVGRHCGSLAMIAIEIRASVTVMEIQKGALLCL